MIHMPATGQCGFDLYIGPPFQQRYHSTTMYDSTQATCELTLFDSPENKTGVFT
jgi:hypothetical protein